MKSGFFSLFLLSLLFFLSQEASNQTLDHQIFLRELENSNDNMYREFIQRYNDYLSGHPDDVAVIIEKCKFMEFAQYNADEEYNPNQEAFDSCTADLVRRFPDNPEVLIFQTSYLWGEDLEGVFEKAEVAIANNPDHWDRSLRSRLYIAVSDHHYWNDNYDSALIYIEKAGTEDSLYKYSLQYARILQNKGRNDEAVRVLLSGKDTANDLGTLSQKAGILLELQKFNEALDIYRRIDQLDSNYNDRSSLAATLEGIGHYEKAREYLVSDTAQNWDKETACRILLIHDLKYQDRDRCIESYNKFRNAGFSSDPLALFRLKLFFKHPALPWKFRDLPALFCLLLILALLIVVPSVWILPVYFIGHKWRYTERQKSYQPLWNLKVFWFISSGYLFASFFSIIRDPQWLYSMFNSSYYDAGQEVLGTSALIFMIVCAFIGLAVLYKVRPSIFGGRNWIIPNNIFLPLILLLAFKAVSTFYITIATKLGLNADEIARIPHLIMSSREDLEALVATHGKITGILFICLIGPLYEEILFRGVVLDSCHKYLNFNLANTVQSTLFASIHMSLFMFPLFFIFGFITGILRKKSDGLLPGIIFHVVNNAVAICITLSQLGG